MDEGALLQKPARRRPWFIFIGVAALVAILGLVLLRGRSRQRTRETIERLSEILSEPSLSDDAQPIESRFSQALAALAGERGTTPERLKQEFDRFDAGFIPGVRPSAHDAALADLSEGRFSSALHEAREYSSADAAQPAAIEGRCHLLAGEILSADNHLQEAEAQLRLALMKINAAAHGHRLLIAKLRLADVLQREKRDAEAEPLWRAADAAAPLADGLSAARLAMAQARLGQALRNQAKPADAERVLAQAEENAAPERSANPLFLSRVVNEHGLALMQLNRPADAEHKFQDSLALAEKGGDQTLAAVVSGNLGFAIGRQGRVAEAEPLVRKTVELVEKSVQKNPFSTPAKEALAGQLRSFSEVLRSCGKYQEAAEADLRLAEIIKSLRGSANAEMADVLVDLAFCQRQIGKDDEAEQNYHEAIAILEKVAGPDHYPVARPLNDLAVMLRAQGRYTEAVRLLKRAMEITDQNLPANDLRRAVTMGNLGSLMAYTGQADQGEILIRRAISLQNQASGPPDAMLQSMFTNLAESLIIQGQREDAAPYYGKALAIAADSSRRAGKDLPELAAARANYQACLKVLKMPEEEIARKAEALEHPEHPAKEGGGP